MDNRGRQIEQWWKTSRFLWAAALTVWVGTFFAGWYTHGIGDSITPKPQRLAGYQFVSPLLTCNFSAIKEFPQSQSISGAIQSVITAHKNNGDVEKASVYFGDFLTGQWANVNGSEKYYPSSLGKVPIMMAYLGLAEGSGTILSEKIAYPFGSPDLNATQEIKPSDPIVPGEAYTVSDLIDHMIKYSDNNAAQLLFDHANQSDLDSVYADLRIPIENQVTSSTLDFMTPQQYAVLFRTLYNATYLSHESSEEALRIMSGSSFTQGIVAGVPSSTVVSHKFGIVSFTNGVITTDRELHDCGIVYAPGHSYLLCVMTRGNSSLSNMENTIADISRAVYKAVQ